MLHSFCSCKCENQFQLLCALEHLLFFVQEPKQSVNEGRNHCSRESMTSHKENTSSYGILSKPEISVVSVQDFWEKISGKRQWKVQSLVSKFPFYILHYLSFLDQERWWSSTLLLLQPGIEVVSTHFNVLLSHALSGPLRETVQSL